MGDCTVLKLVIEKGPREGETLEFRPGSIIRLGRVVRGNSVTIKDSGISTKHLQIHFENDSGKWVITDLGSSNGTILNDIMLDAHTPFSLSDNDVVKLGEITMIVVNICAADVGVPRSSRRKGVGVGVGVGESSVVRNKGGVGEDCEVGLGENVAEKPKRGRKKIIKVEVIEGVGNHEVKKDGEVEEIGNVKGNDKVVLVDVNQGRQLRSRVTRNAKKEEGGKLGSVEEFGKQLESLAAIERKTRKGRGKKKVVEDEAGIEVVEDKAGKEVEEGLVKDLPEVVLDRDVKEDTINAINEVSDKLGVDDVLETKDVEQKEEGSGVKNGDVDLEAEMDLEKLTLGEWFDFLEVYLPKKIHDETEELISNMKERVKQFHEYSVEQKHAMGKGRSPIA